MVRLTLTQALIVFDGITGFAYLGIQAVLNHSDRRVPAHCDRAYAIFGLSLMMAAVINGELRLLI